MSDLRGSGSLEQDADVILFPYRPAYRLERLLQEGDAGRKAGSSKGYIRAQNLLEIQIAKQRNGPTETLNFWVDMKANVVRDLNWGTRDGQTWIRMRRSMSFVRPRCGVRACVMGSLQET